VSLRHFEYSAETTVSPARVRAAVLDFSDRRPDVWPGLSRAQYKVIEKGETTALVREGTANLWAIEKYDWSDPEVVRWTLQESNFAHPGTAWQMRISPRDGGGSRVDVVLERNYRGFRGKLLQLGFDLFDGGKVLAGYLRRTLTILEKE
jgi:hypothetical protein